MPFGQIVIGPAGSGKTTFCTGMQELLRSLGRTCHVINLDPGNIRSTFPDEDLLPRYTPTVDISQVCSQWDLMSKLSIGPNAALVEAMKLLARSPLSSWLVSEISYLIPSTESDIEPLKEDNIEMPYFLFDCPGQAELITHEPFISEIVSTLSSSLNFRLVAVCLIDSSTTSISNDRLISAKLLSLSAMACIELPFVNVFSKSDLLSSSQLGLEIEEDTASFNDENYTHKEVQLISGQEKIWKLLEELVEEIPYVNHIPLAVEDKNSMVHVLRAADRANGFAFGGLTPANDSIMKVSTSIDIVN